MMDSDSMAEPDAVGPSPLLNSPDHPGVNEAPVDPAIVAQAARLDQARRLQVLLLAIGVAGLLVEALWFFPPLTWMAPAWLYATARVAWHGVLMPCDSPPREGIGYWLGTAVAGLIQGLLLSGQLMIESIAVFAPLGLAVQCVNLLLTVTDPVLIVGLVVATVPIGLAAATVAFYLVVRIFPNRLAPYWPLEAPSPMDPAEKATDAASPTA
jgi:hypothetical protein